MADTKTPPVDPAQQTPPVDPVPTPPVDPAPATADDGQTFPAEYVRQLREEAKGYRLELQKQKEDAAAKHEAALAEQGEYKELYETQKAELEQFKAKAGEWDAYREQQKTALIEKLPEEMRKKYEAMDAALVLDVVPDLIAQLEAKQPPSNPDPTKAKLTQQQGGDKSKPWKGFYNTPAQ